jgi:hypothetical protein
MLIVALFGGVHAALGFNSGGYYKCGALVSRFSALMFSFVLKFLIK